MAETKETVLVSIEVDNKEAIANIDKQTKATEDQGKVQKKTTKATEDQTNATNEMTGALDSMLGQLGLSTQGLKSMSSGVGNTIKGLKSFKVALASTGIGLLIVALGSLYAWFNKTSEGQEKLKLITAGLGATFDVLMDTLASLGELLFNTFTKPEEALKSFSDSIKKYVTDKFNAIFDSLGLLGEAIKKVFQGDFKGALEDATKGGAALVGELSGAADVMRIANSVIEETKDIIKEVTEESSKAVQIQREANALKQKQIAALTSQAKLEVSIAEEKTKAATVEGQTNQERLDASNKAIELTKQLQAERKTLLNEELDQLQRAQALGNNTIEDDEKREQLKREIILLDKQQADSLKELVGQQGALIAGIQAEADLKAKLAQDEIDKEAARTSTAEEKLEEAKLKVAEENALEIENAQLQADALLLIEEERYKNELASKERNVAEKALLDFQYQTKVDKINKDAEKKQKSLDSTLEKSKKDQVEADLVNVGDSLSEQLDLGKEFALAQTIVNAAQGVGKTIGTVGLPAALPFIAAQALLIAKSVSDINKAERGMMIGGKRHSQGGTLVEAEEGELIMNRNSVAMFTEELSAISIAGGGIPFAQRGLAVASTTGRAIQESEAANLSSIAAQSTAILVTEDLYSVEQRVGVTEDIATF